MFRYLRIILWKIVSELEQKLYPYECDEDYYYEVKNDETGERYMIIDWIKSFDERIIRLQDEMLWVKSEIHSINDTNGQK
jgi:hypothetical protein